MVEAIIFDCDGVLVDSVTANANATRTVLESIGLDCDPDIWIGSSNRELGAWIASERPELTPEEVSTLFARMHQHSLSAIRPMDGAARLLRELALPFAVASNEDRQFLREKLHATGLSGAVGLRYFSSEDVGRPKPAPDLYLHVASMLGVNPAQCIAVEDSVAGATSALAAGMSCLLLRNDRLEYPAELLRRVTEVSALSEARHHLTPRKSRTRELS